MRYHILIVEDDKITRDVFMQLLNNRGFFCKSARDGEEALMILAMEDFDILVIDLMLPGKNGAEVAWQARQNGVNTPMIAISGQTEIWDLDDLMDCGFSQFIAKPFSLELLCEKILQILHYS